MNPQLMIGDELVVPGLPQHKMLYVGPIGPRGEDVLDPAKGVPVRLRHFSSIPDGNQLLLGKRGTNNWFESQQIQARALEVVNRGVVNHTLGPNCEHITSFVRHGENPSSPQLKFWGAVGVAALLFVALK